MSEAKRDDSELKPLLVSIARAFQERNGQEATIRYLAKRVREKQRLVLDMLEDVEASEGGICINVAVRCGNGIYKYERIGDYSVSYLGN